MVISNDPSNQYRPAVVNNPDGGYFLVAWSDTRISTVPNIYGQLVGNNGRLLVAGSLSEQQTPANFPISTAVMAWGGQ